MNVENILKLADAIDAAAKPDAKPLIGFNMLFYLWNEGEPRDNTGHNCGTVCCIAGWAAFLKGGGRAAPRNEESIPERARAFLGLDQATGGSLFMPNVDELWNDIEPARAAAVLRHLAATGVVDWNVRAPA